MDNTHLTKVWLNIE